MQPGYNSHVIKIAVVFLIIAGFVYPIRWLLTPKSFGDLGHYRADAIGEEAAKVPRHGTNISCLKCHEYEFDNLLSGHHKTLSCEFCHGTYADHVKGDQKTANLDIKQGKEINALCLRCHNNEIVARPKSMIKTIVMPDHLRDQMVNEKHTCNQCHYVHDPLKYINRPSRTAEMQEALNE